MAIILDADVIIRGERGAFDLRSWVAAQPEEEFEIAAITVAELWHGVEGADLTNRTKRRKYLEGILKILPVIPYTEQTAYEHARIWSEFQSAGKMTGFYDIIVAATALERSSSVATFNRRHFENIDGLTVIVPKTSGATTKRPASASDPEMTQLA